MNKAQLEKLRQAQEEDREVMKLLAEREVERAREIGEKAREEVLLEGTKDLSGYLCSGFLILLVTYVGYLCSGSGEPTADLFGYPDECSPAVLSVNASMTEFSLGNLNEISSSLKIPETTHSDYEDFTHPYHWTSPGERISRVVEDEGYGPEWFHVSVKTDMAGVTPEQFRKWWSFVNCSAVYSWWHPRDHVYGVWLDARSEEEESHRVVERAGMIHRVKEYVGGKLNNLDIIFMDPCLGREQDCNSHQLLFQAKVVLHGHVTTHFPVIGRVKAGNLYHTLTYTDDGVSTLHSKFVLGRDVQCVDYPDSWGCYIFQQISPLLKKVMLGEEQVRAIYRHCKEEMFVLGRLIARLSRDKLL